MQKPLGEVFMAVTRGDTAENLYEFEVDAAD
jgi:hypothetical protein